MSFKTLNISMTKILKCDWYNVLFDALCNTLQYVSLQLGLVLHCLIFS